MKRGFMTTSRHGMAPAARPAQGLRSRSLVLVLLVLGGGVEGVELPAVADHDEGERLLLLGVLAGDGDGARGPVAVDLDAAELRLDLRLLRFAALLFVQRL